MEISDELDKNLNAGLILKVFKDGDKIRDQAAALAYIEYIATLKPDNLYKCYKSVFEFSGETELPD